MEGAFPQKIGDEWWWVDEDTYEPIALMTDADLESEIAGGRVAAGEVQSPTAGEAPPGAGEAAGAAQGWVFVSDTTKEPQVVQAVNAVSGDPRVRRAMLLAAQMEGSIYGPWGTGPGGEHVGDSGDAVGPWQINFGPANDPNRDGVRERADGTKITREEAADPAKAAAWMLPEFIAGVQKVPAEVWESDPFYAAATAMYHAERPYGYGDPSKAVFDVYNRSVAESAWNELASADWVPDMPTGPGLPSLTPDQYAEWSDYKALFDMPIDAYKAALIQGADPLAHWFDLQEKQLDMALEEGNISREEYDAGIEERLSFDQIVFARDQELDFGDYRNLLMAGVSDAEIMDFLRWGYEPDEYLFAVSQGALSHDDVRQAAAEDKDLIEVIAENRMPEEDVERQAEFQAEWAKLKNGLPAELRFDPTFSAYLSDLEDDAWEGEQAAMTERREAREARLRGQVGAMAPPGTIPVIGGEAVDEATGQTVPRQAPEEEKVEPYKAPSVHRVLIDAAEAGIPMLREGPMVRQSGAFGGLDIGEGIGGFAPGTWSQREYPTKEFTEFGSYAMGPLMGREYLRGNVRPGRGRGEAARLEETRRAAAEEYPEIAEEEGYIRLPRPKKRRAGALPPR